MEKVSQTLRQAREQRRISREEAAQHTHIPLPYLTALEGEGLDARQRSRLLPDPLYLIPHLQRYATFLDLDANTAVAQFTNELQEIQEGAYKAEAAPQPRPRLGPSPQRSRAISVSIVLASILVTLALIGQYSDLNIDTARQGESSPPTPSPTPFEAPAQHSLSDPQRSPEANAAPAQTPSSSSLSLPSTSTDSPLAPPSLDQSGSSSAPAAQPSQVGGSAPDSSQAYVESPALTAPVNTTAHRLFVQAKETTWIRVVMGGQSPQEAILKPGESVEWTSDSLFSVTLGNAGGVTLTVDGQELPPLGKSGQVLRNIRLPYAAEVQR